MTEKRFRVTINDENDVRFVDCVDNTQLISISFKEYKDAVDCRDALLYQCDLMNKLYEENEQLKQQKTGLLRIIKNNIEIYENINTNVEFHKGEIQGKLTLLYNLKEVILND